MNTPFSTEIAGGAEGVIGLSGIAVGAEAARQRDVVAGKESRIVVGAPQLDALFQESQRGIELVPLIVKVAQPAADIGGDGGEVSAES